VQSDNSKEEISDDIEQDEILAVVAHMKKNPQSLLKKKKCSSHSSRIFDYVF